MNLPTLYKKTSTGAIQFWEIKVTDRNGNVMFPHGHHALVTTYGQLNTDLPQVTVDVISKGKNVGKKNETSIQQQAEAEAQAKWEKQKKKGYVETIDDAQNDKLDALIEGGIVPMLAHKFSEHGHKIKYPCYAQPKLDGIRCIAIVKDGACTLWSRTRKPITSCPHIVQELEAAFEHKDIVLDGELYNHDFKNNFEHIVHLVRQEVPDEKHADVEYHVYDVVSNDTFKSRTESLALLFGAFEFYSLKYVPTIQVSSEDAVMQYFEGFSSNGYEGIMLRNADSRYVNKRSYDLLKVKEFDDAEFEITGIEEGRGKLAGHVGAFVCRTRDGKDFKAKAKGDTERLREYFDDHSLWQGKLLTVQYQGLSAYGIPRFPVGIRLRLEGT